MYNDEGIETDSSRDAFILNGSIKNKKDTILHKEVHMNYLLSKMNKPLSEYLSVLTPWVATWFMNSFYVLLGKQKFLYELHEGRIKKLKDLSNDILSYQSTGFSGGPNQLPSVGNTYAALVFLTAVNRIHEVDKEKVIEFLKSMKVKNGFTMHKNGETDARTLYCAISSFSLLFPEHVKYNEQLNPLSTPQGKELFSDSERIISELQTYEGGYSARKGEEAHAGYTYSAVSSLIILQKQPTRLSLLKKWLKNRQDPLIKGLNGRTEKGVDSCYNYWVGACYKLLNINEYSFEDLAVYTLSNCQSASGGMKSVPDARSDVYHSCYALLGLYLKDAKDYNAALGVPVLFSPF
ncbi:protein farnesyltransferase subunit beta [Nematocida sp. LUAm3]|nr:protein farnesyltransferase subunit beta [Nematocida sp. LUAm3]KAI5176357.1 protein farnesyltransferase subunit beta [Nematocida sp. LUAm2]KAI5179369.1 protein farnesyltransferase subunit beta [Nematocida sp. LUAm1]